MPRNRTLLLTVGCASALIGLYAMARSLYESVVSPSDDLRVKVDVCRFDGRLLLSIRNEGGSRLVAANGDLSNPHTLRTGASDGVFSPTCDRIAYKGPLPGGNGCGIYVTNLPAGSSKPLTQDHGVCDSQPSFSPDGRKIAFIRAVQHPGAAYSDVWTDADVWTVNIATGQKRRITRLNAYEVGRPVFLADGTAVLFQTTASDYGFERADLAGTAPPRRIGACTWCWDPAVFWPTDRIGYVSQAGEVMDAGSDMKAPVQLTHMRASADCPTFSGDGKTVYFIASPHEQDELELWSVGISGGAPRRLCGPDFFRGFLK
jgi:Tol biopolymer transport system component